MEHPLKFSHYYAGLGALIAWAAILIQYIVMIQNRTDSIAATTIHFLGYFTILSNILVAVVFSIIYFNGGLSGTKNISTSLLTATCLYIVVVAIIYNLVFRKLSEPTGWNRIANELLHVLVPLIFAIFWVVFVPKVRLGLKDSFLWLIFPFAYLLYTLIAGYFMNRYPYPFVNVTELGITRTLFNCMGVALVFWVLGCLLIWLKVKIGR